MVGLKHFLSTSALLGKNVAMKEFDSPEKKSFWGQTVTTRLDNDSLLNFVGCSCFL